MRPIVRLNPHNLILVCIIQLSFHICLDREMEHCSAGVGEAVQCGVVPGFLRDELGAPEAVLWAAAARDEDGAIVNGDGDTLL